MQIRHSNLLAQSHFLQTEAEPKLVSRIVELVLWHKLIKAKFYKPWDLLPDQKAKIESQIAEAEDEVEREATQSNDEGPQEGTALKLEHKDDLKPKDEEMESRPSPGDTVGSSTDKPEDLHGGKNDFANTDPPGLKAEPEPASETSEALKDQNDDGSEVMEGVEDTVIY